jgi:hypothetical protein
MPDLKTGDTAYFSVWADRNCGPPFEHELSGVILDDDYEPNDDDRAMDTIGYLEAGQRYMVVDIGDDRLYVIAAQRDVRAEPRPPYVPRQWSDE